MSLEFPAAAGRAGEALLREAPSLFPGRLTADFLPSQCPLLLCLPWYFQRSGLGPLLYLYPPMPSGLLALNAISMLKTLQFVSSSSFPMSSIIFINSTSLLGLLRGITHKNSFQLQVFPFSVNSNSILQVTQAKVSFVSLLLHLPSSPSENPIGPTFRIQIESHHLSPPPQLSSYPTRLSLKSFLTGPPVATPASPHSPFFLRAPLLAQLVKNPPAMQETPV